MQICSVGLGLHTENSQQTKLRVGSSGNHIVRIYYKLIGDDY